MYIKTGHLSCRVPGLGSIAFRSSYQDKVYYDVTLQHSTNVTSQVTSDDIRESPRDSLVRRLFAAYRAMMRADIKAHIKARYHNDPKEFWKYAKRR